MANIENYVQPSRLYRYRPVDKLNREPDAIAEAYLRKIEERIEPFDIPIRRMKLDGHAMTFQ